MNSLDLFYTITSVTGPKVMVLHFHQVPETGLHETQEKLILEVLDDLAFVGWNECVSGLRFDAALSRMKELQHLIDEPTTPIPWIQLPIAKKLVIKRALQQKQLELKRLLSGFQFNRTLLERDIAELEQDLRA